MNMATGIYHIKNKTNDHIYIGQSIDIHRRFNDHLRALRQNAHYNIKLQTSWNNDGETNFEFSVIFECLAHVLSFHEKEQVEKIPEYKRYNILKNYDTLTGKNNPFYGKRHSLQTKCKLSALAKKRKGNKNPNYANDYSVETRIKSGHNKQTKLTKKQVQKIIEIKNKTHQEIADIYGISRSVITRIKNGTRWGLVTGIKNISAYKRRSL